MSKKMMKRSLALSALMAFVITGSAMTADSITIGENETKTLSNLSNGFSVVGEKGSTVNMNNWLTSYGTMTGLENLNITAT